MVGVVKVIDGERANMSLTGVTGGWRGCGEEGEGEEGKGGRGESNRFEVGGRWPRPVGWGGRRWLGEVE